VLFIINLCPSVLNFGFKVGDYIMPFNINEEKGMTLLEVMGALVILSLLAVTMLSLFSTSGMWIAGAGRQTRASEYAAAVIEVARAYTNDINPASLPLKFEDDDIMDSKFTFRLNPADTSGPQIEIKAPVKMKAAIDIKQHNDNAYYAAGFHKTIQNNLFDIKVTITWNELGHNRQYELCTITSAR